MEIPQLNIISPGASQPGSGVASLPRPTSEQAVVKQDAPPVPVSADAVQAVIRTIDGNQVRQAVDKVNKVVQALASDLKFNVDDDTGMLVVKVVDQSTKEVIRQIPSEEMLSIAKSLDRLQGLLVRQKV